MDGYLANLPDICALADKYNAVVLVDDSHAVGFMGPNGRGTPEHFGVTDRIDIITGTLGKALGGASGGYTSGRKPLIDLLRQRSRPYLFSNTLAPAIVGASIRDDTGSWSEGRAAGGEPDSAVHAPEAIWGPAGASPDETPAKARGTTAAGE